MNDDSGPFYLYEQLENSANRVDDQHHSRLELTYKWKWLDLNWSDRNRYEFRYIESESKPLYRNRIRFEKPLKVGGQKIIPYLSNEFFVDLKVDKFNQNRSIGGVKKSFNKSVSAAVYYMRKFDKSDDEWSDDSIIGTQLSITF